MGVDGILDYTKPEAEAGWNFKPYFYPASLTPRLKDTPGKSWGDPAYVRSCVVVAI